MSSRLQTIYMSIPTISETLAPVKEWINQRLVVVLMRLTLMAIAGNMLHWFLTVAYHAIRVLAGLNYMKFIDIFG